jgi:hypothetical protein
MAFDLSSLLIHSESVPRAAREQLALARRGPPELRDAALEAAAGSLQLEADLGCTDARELVGLDPSLCCG